MSQFRVAGAYGADVDKNPSMSAIGLSCAAAARRPWLTADG